MQRQGIRRLLDARRRDEAGFTLVEILVVIIIIGILAAIAIPVFLSQRQKGHDAAAKSDIYTVAQAEEDYYASTGSYGNLTQVLNEEHLHLTPGSTVATIFVDPTKGYCLGSFSSGGSPLPPGEASVSTFASNVVFWWDSQAGGLQPAGAALNGALTGCPTTTNPADFVYKSF